MLQRIQASRVALAIEEVPIVLNLHLICRKQFLFGLTEHGQMVELVGSGFSTPHSGIEAQFG
jgi:hypothetical protein